MSTTRRHIIIDPAEEPALDLSPVATEAATKPAKPKAKPKSKPKGKPKPKPSKPKNYDVLKPIGTPIAPPKPGRESQDRYTGILEELIKRQSSTRPWHSEPLAVWKYTAVIVTPTP